MKLSTGKKPFKINFDTGDTETIFFNPNDPDLAEKLNSLPDRIKERTDVLDDVVLGEDGEPTNRDDVYLYSEFKKAVYEEIDKTFGSNVSEKVFKYCSAFAVVDGRFFVEQFVESIVPEIEKEIKKDRKAMDKHIKEYV